MELAQNNAQWGLGY